MMRTASSPRALHGTAAAQNENEWCGRVTSRQLSFEVPERGTFGVVCWCVYDTRRVQFMTTKYVKKKFVRRGRKVFDTQQNAFKEITIVRLLVQNEYN